MTTETKLRDLGDRLEQSIGAEVRAARPASSIVRRRLPVLSIATAGLAAAGVATVLLVGSGSSSPRVGAGGGQITITPAGGSAHAGDAAYIIKRVRARVAASAGEGLVTEGYDYSSGQVQADGSLTDLSDPTGLTWQYAAPDGATYFSNLDMNRTMVGAGEIGATVNGRYHVSSVTIDRASKTYSTSQNTLSAPNASDAGNSGAGVVSTDSTSDQVIRALHSGQATLEGTTTVNGTPAIALQVTESNGSYAQNWLYVDAKSYQPLRFILDVTGTDGGHFGTGLYVTDWYPSTPANIARAKDQTIPAGYTRVANADPSGNSGNSGS